MTQTWNRDLLKPAPSLSLRHRVHGDSSRGGEDQSGNQTPLVPAPKGSIHPPSPSPQTWSRGPTDTWRTLLDTCSQLSPCGWLGVTPWRYHRFPRRETSVRNWCETLSVRTPRRVCAAGRSDREDGWAGSLSTSARSLGRPCPPRPACTPLHHSRAGLGWHPRPLSTHENLRTRSSLNDTVTWAGIRRLGASSSPCSSVTMTGQERARAEPLRGGLG